MHVYREELLNFEAGRTGSMLKNGMSLERLHLLLYGDQHAAETESKGCIEED